MFTTQTAQLAGLPPQSIKYNTAVDVGLGYVLPPTGRVFFVRGNGTTVTDLDDQYSIMTTDMERRLFPSVSGVLASCKASRGDTIVVLPGHTENIASADAWALVAGLRIIGLGYGNTRPTFTFTVAAATVLLDVAGLVIQNCRFLCSGPAGTTALTVAAPFTVTGEGCLLIDNYFEIGIDADQIVGTFLTVKAANCGLYGNRIVALAAAAPCTSCIVLGDADEGADGFTAVGNYIKAATSAVAVGLIENITSTATSNDILIEKNYIQNWRAVSEKCISFAGNMVTTGVIRENQFKVYLNSIVQGVTYSGTGVDVSLDNNRISNVANETALQNQGTASA